MGRLTGALTFGLVVLVSHSLASGQARPAPPPADQTAAPNRPGWSVDTLHGCWLWNAYPQAGETVSWSGACDAGGRATGPGDAEWRLGGKVERSEGQYNEGRKQGHGTFRFSNGNRYIGEFRDDAFHGRGTMIFAKGGLYEGEWQKGQPHGRGTFKYPTGARYDGDWRDGRQSGRGTLTSFDGNWYEGEWRDGKPNGKGVYTRIDGNRFSGDWLDGCLQDARRSVSIERPLEECR